jgi:hypothetical protein
MSEAARERGYKAGAENCGTSIGQSENNLSLFFLSNVLPVPTSL